MKIKVVSRIVSTILCSILIIISIFSVYDYLLVKNGHKPIFCIKQNVNAESYECKSALYKYYYTTGDGYTSIRFIPLWEELGAKK